MKRILFLISLILFFIPTGNISANEYFYVDLQNIYELNDEGTGLVNDIFSVENKTTEKYLPSFIYKIKNVNINEVAVFFNGRELIPITKRNDTETEIKINFDEKVLGKGNQTKFTVSYKINNLASRTGDVWELSIPGVENISDYRNLNTTVNIPKTYGNEAYISPRYTDKTEDENLFRYVFSKEDIEGSRIVAGFGEYQIFSFTINYHLRNDGLNTELMSIAIPPDSSYQRLYYKEISPKPEIITTDDDGNWIASYRLKGNSSIDASIKGNVQLFANPRKYLSPKVSELYRNIDETIYWQTTNESIVNLSKELKTPDKMYEYVVNNLTYDNNLTNKERLGSVKSLDKNYSVTCREYTDLLITLLRASGIPAREIVGYAYTENPTTKPLSFFNDILHSWVEYWDNEKGIWISVDPTWGSTSKTDYFNKFDLRHFAFTVHGLSDTKPYPPGVGNEDTNEKDIYINFGDFESVNESSLEVNIQKNPFFLFNRNINITIKNNNPIAVYEKNIKYIIDGKLVSEDNIKVIPPYSEIDKTINSRFSILGLRTGKNITVLVNGLSSEFPGFKTIDAYSQLIIFFILVIITILSILLNNHKRKYKIQ